MSKSTVRTGAPAPSSGGYIKPPADISRPVIIPSSSSNSSASDSESNESACKTTPLPRSRVKKRGRPKKANQVYDIKDCNCAAISDSDCSCVGNIRSKQRIPGREASNMHSNSQQLLSIYKGFVHPENIRTMFYHLCGTFAFYVMLYPMVNFVWTFCSNNETLMITLFNQVTSGLTNDDGYWKHFTNLKWLRWPPTTPETVALLLASALKDTIVIHWQGIAQDLTLRDMICMSLAQSKRRC